MEILVPMDSGDKRPLYEQIYAYIRREIRRGSLGYGERLPSTRVLAENLKVSRSTTQMAYEQLLAEGYIEAVPYKGYFVARMEELVDMEPGGNGEMALEAAVEPDRGCRIDFSPRGIDLDSFPYNTWRKLSRDTLVDDNKEFFLSGDPQGEPGLREAVRGYLHAARGVECAPDQIIIGAGSEYLLMLLSRILGRDHRIAMENPTYKQAYRVLCSAGYPVCPVGMDASGMNPGLLEESGADIAYVMPSHQYPTGIVMPVVRRQELLQWAGQKKDRFLIEDDYDSEFRYRGRPIPALQGLDKSGKVIYMGTFSKSIAPAIRIGYMVLPRPLLGVYREKLGFYASTVSRIDQNIIYQFLTGGYYERHLNRMRAIYKGKHDLLLGRLKELEEDFEIYGENAGLHILLRNRKGKAESRLVEQAQERGVRVYGLSSCCIGEEHVSRSSTVVLGYARLSEEQINRGTGLLREAWKES